MEMMKKIIAKTDASGHLGSNVELPPDCFIEIFIPVKNSEPKADSVIRKPHPAIAGAATFVGDPFAPCYDDDELELD